MYQIMSDMSSTLGPCPICGRILTETSTNAHHLIPKTFGGKDTVDLHRVCHSKIHATFSERELLHLYNTVEKLREHPDIQSFVKWIRSKDPEFQSKHKDSTERRRKRRK